MMTSITSTPPPPPSQPRYSSPSKQMEATTTFLRNGPWSMDVFSPPLESPSNSNAPIIVGAIDPPWYCAVTKETGEREEGESGGLQAYRITVVYHSNYASTLRHSPLSPSRILPHCEWTLTVNTTPELRGVPPLLQLLQQPNTQVAYIYLIHPLQGSIHLYKIAPPPSNPSHSATPRCLAPSLAISIDIDAAGGAMTAFHASWGPQTTTPLLLMGGANGTLYQLRQSHIPLSLRAVPIHRAAEDSGGGGPWTRLWSHRPLVGSRTDRCAAAAIVQLVAWGTRWAAFSETGTLFLYQKKKDGTTGGEGNVSHFQLSHQLSLSDFVRENQASNTAMGEMVQVLALTASTTSSSSNNTASSTNATLRSTAADALHVIVLTHHRPTDQSRLYWLVATNDSNDDVEHDHWKWKNPPLWIDRCVDPPNCTISDFAADASGLVYLWLCEEAATTVLLVGDGTRIRAELDWPGTAAELLPRTARADAQALVVWDTGGIPWRVQYTIPPPPRFSEESMIEEEENLSSHTHLVEKQTTHLLSLFRGSYYRRPGPLRLPPSLVQTTELDVAVLAAARQLLYSAADSPGATASKSTNYLDVHVAFIQMLQQSGLYRNCSQLCKWNLMSLGQQASVLGALHGLTLGPQALWNSSIWDAWVYPEEKEAELDTFLVDGYDLHCRTEKKVDPRSTWLAGWSTLLSAAVTFREERAAVLYDLAPNPPPVVRRIADVPIWTTRPVLQSLMKEWIVEYGRTTGVATLDQIEYLVQLYLLSCSDTFASCPNASTRAAYVAAQQLSVETIRRRHGRSEDEFLWEISLAHRSFRSVCQLAHDHERRRDRSLFSLEPHLVRLAKQEDMETGMPFSLYVLKWHVDRGYMGHVFQYGKHCPLELNQLIHNEETLKPYRWIHSVRQGDYNSATDSLFHGALLPNIPFTVAKTSLSMATMASSIVEEELLTSRDMTRKRRQAMNRKMELMQAQRDLMGVDAVQKDTLRLWTSERLLDFAMDKAEKQTHRNDRSEALFLGLFVCTTMETDHEVSEGAITIWHKAICMDAEFWNKCLASESDLVCPILCERIVNQTIFGGLLQMSHVLQMDWESVTYNSIADDLVARYGKPYPLLLKPGMQRLLHSVVQYLDRASEEAMQ